MKVIVIHGFGDLFVKCHVPCLLDVGFKGKNIFKALLLLVNHNKLREGILGKIKTNCLNTSYK